MDPFTTDPGLHFWLIGMALLATVGCGIYVAFARVLMIRVFAGLGAAFSFVILVWLVGIAMSRSG